MLIGMRNTSKILLLPLAVASILFVTPATRADVVEIRPVVVREGDPASSAIGIEYRSGDTLIARSTPAAPAGVALKLPGGEWQPVSFHTQAEQGKAIVLGPEKVGPLTFRWSLEQKTPSLVERVLEVTADAKPSGEDAATTQSQQFTVAFPLDLAIDGSQASFSGPEAARVVYDAGDRKKKHQTFPVAMLRTADRVFGIAPDSPGLWENRCQVAFDPPAHRLEITTGDGCEPYTMMLAPPRTPATPTSIGWTAGSRSPRARRCGSRPGCSPARPSPTTSPSRPTTVRAMRVISHPSWYGTTYPQRSRDLTSSISGRRLPRQS